MLTPQAIYSFYQADSELSKTLPRYPLLPPEIQVIPNGEKGLIFSGAMGIKIFQGESAVRTIPLLVPYLNGSNTVEEVSSHVSCLDSLDIKRVVCFLHFHGLLEHGDTKHREVEPSYIGTYGLVQQLPMSRHEIMSSIRDQRILLIGPNDFTKHLVNQFYDLGINNVVETNSSNIDQTTVHDYSCILYLKVRHKEQNKTPLVSNKDLANTHLFYCEIAESVVQIGPVLPNAPLGELDNISLIKALATETTIPITKELSLACIALQFYNFLSKLTTRNLFNSCLLAFNTGQGLETHSCLMTLSDQKISAGNNPNNKPLTKNLLRYHASLDVPPPDYVSPKSYRVHYEQSNLLAASLAPPKLHGAPRTTLHQPDAILPKSAKNTVLNAPRSVSLSHITAILYYAVGYRAPKEDEKGHPRRIAPSGGNLQSCQFYLLAQGIDGLENGVYRYNGMEHCLEQLTSIRLDLLHDLLEDPGDTGLYIFSISDHGKLERKYGPRAFRITHFDAGVSAFYARTVAMTNRLLFTDYPHFTHKALMAVLGMPTINNNFVLTGLYKITTESHNDHSLSQLEAQLDYRRFFSNKTDQDRGSLPTNAPLLDYNADNLNHALLHRKSHRYFSEKAINKTVLVSILKGLHNLPGSYSHPKSNGFTIDIIVIVKNTTQDLKAGIYRFDSSLTLISPSSLTTKQVNHFISQSFPAEAPVIIMFTLNPGEFTSYSDYRRAHYITGNMLAALWVATEMQGIGGVPMGAVSSIGYQQQIPKGEYNHYPLLGFCIGYPTEQETP